MVRLLLIIAWVLVLSTSARTAEFSEPIDGILQIDGVIVSEDAVRLESELDRVRPYRVQLNSLGGHILTAIDMSFTLRSRALPTAVSAGDVCASACVIVLAGGVHVSISQKSRIGLHEAAAFIEGDNKKGMVRSEVGTRWFSSLLALLTNGNRECLDALVRSSSFESMTWVGGKELTHCGIKWVVS